MYVGSFFMIALIGFIILAVGIAKLLGSISKKAPQSSIDKPAERPKKSSKRWIVYIVVAIILSFWSGAMALFFLLILWIILKNPSRGMSSEISKTEKSVARRVYTWLFVSSIFTVPFFIYLLLVTDAGRSSSNKLVLTALIPLLLHLPLLLGLTSKSIFVYRHTQQGILLIALRAFVAAVALNIGEYPYEGIWLFLFGNGSLWLFGSIWGWVQVNRGDCWWMKQKGDVIAALGSPKIESPRLLSPEQCLEYSKWYLKRQLQKSAKELALEAYRRGNYEIKHQAIRVLDDMNEVELF
jgi:hypothetical protein